MALPNNNKRKVFDGRYEVISIVGRGSDSVVYHARHAGSPTQEVALKVLLSQKDKSNLAERLRKEALTLVSCRHRYVVRLDDFHSIGDLCYLSMEYAPLGDLRKFITSRKTPLSPELGERFLRQSLEALDFVHATGVLHRDLKPDNILVVSEREVRLADFGLALLPGEEARIEELQSGVGSLGYLPPEVLEGTHFDQISDQYALGLCFYEMIAGKHPFEGAPLADQLEVRRDESFPELRSIVPSVTEHLNRVIMKMLRFNPEDRYSSTLNALKAINDPEYSEEAAKKKSSAVAAAVSRAAIEEPDPFFFDDEDGDDDDFGINPFNDPEPIQSVEASAQSASIFPIEKSVAVANSDTPESSATPTVQQPSAQSPTPEIHSNVAVAVAEPQEVSTPSESEERVPQPTEKIDLERIKEIIAKDAEQKALTARRRSTSPQTIGKVRESANRTAALGSSNRAAEASGAEASSPSNRSSFATSALEAFQKVPHALRPVVVGLGAAIATIVVVSVAQLFSGTNGPEDTGSVNEVTEVTGSQTEPTHISKDGASQQASIDGSGSELPADAVFPAPPAGIYSGRISGVIPGTSAPFTLISLPKQAMIAVIVGIEGWTPTLVPSTNQAGEPIEPLVVRSNGMILNITGSVVSGIIEGTFANAVTGETGSWQVKKVS